MGQRYYGYSYVTLRWFLLPGFISDQQMMEEQKHQLQDQQQRHDASEERLNRLVKTLATVRAGVEHLAGKLHHITQVSTTSAVPTVNCPTCRLTELPPFFQSVEAAPAVSPDSEEFVLVLLTQFDLKLQMLQRELQEQDVAALLKEMEEEEVSQSFAMLVQHHGWMSHRVVLANLECKLGFVLF